MRRLLSALCAAIAHPASLDRLLGKSGGSVNGLTGGGFRVKGGKNVIIRNLKISLSKAPTDLVAIDSSTNVVRACRLRSCLSLRSVQLTRNRG